MPQHDVYCIICFGILSIVCIVLCYIVSYGILSYLLISYHHSFNSPVGFGEQAAEVRFPYEVLVGCFADAEDLLLPARQHLQRQRRLHFRPQHAQVWRQHVDEDLDVEGRRA